MRSRARLFIGLTALAAAALLSCDRREPYGPTLTERSTAFGPPPHVQFKDTPGYPMDVPRSPRSVDDIESAIGEQGGLATVALKAPESEHVAASGYRTAVSAAQAARGLDAVVALGAEVLDFFDAVNIAVVRIPVERVRAIHASPFVDWVEPAGLRETLTDATEWPSDPAGAPSVPLAAPDAAMAEVIPWNVSQVNAPAAWSQATGAGAKVMLIGAGIGQHYDNPYVTNCGGLAHSCDSRFIDGSLMMGNMLARENGVGVIGVAKGLTAPDVYVWRVITDAGLYDPWVVYAGFSTAYYGGYKLVLYAFAHGSLDQTEATWIGWLWNTGGITVTLVPSDDGQPYASIYPASVSNVVGVSGVRDDGQFAAYPVPGCDIGRGSSYGPMVDVAGPFWSYTTVTTTQGDEWIIDTRGTWGLCSNGMAAAHVAGVIALLQEEYPYPTWSPAQIVDALRSTASNHANPTERLGHGIPNAAAALAYAPAPLQIDIVGPAAVPPNQYCMWVSDVSGGIGPYSYQWWQNGYPRGTDADVMLYTGATSFWVQLQVTDSQGASEYEETYVTNTPEAEECFF